MKTNRWTTAGQPKDISSIPNPLVQVLRRGLHWIWGPNRHREIKEWSIAINNDWVQDISRRRLLLEFHWRIFENLISWHKGKLFGYHRVSFVTIENFQHFLLQTVLTNGMFGWFICQQLLLSHDRTTGLGNSGLETSVVLVYWLLWAFNLLCLLFVPMSVVVWVIHLAMYSFVTCLVLPVMHWQNWASYLWHSEVDFFFIYVYY